VYNYVKALTKHELGRDTEQGQLLKLKKFQRDLVIGGLVGDRDVGGIDAVNTAI
jgi:hypothetical protein